MSLLIVVLVFFFFKQKTAYEMRISDWSSDVCSSDLRAGDLVRPEGGAALAAEVVGLLVDVLEGLEGDVGRQIDGLRHRAVDVALHRGLHDHMRGRLQSLRGHEGWRQRGVLSLQTAEQAVGMVAHLLLASAAVGPQDAAPVGDAERTGRAEWRESGCQNVSTSVVAVS